MVLTDAVRRLSDGLLGLFVRSLPVAAEPCECHTVGACRFPWCYDSTQGAHKNICHCNGCHWYCTSECYLEPRAC
jgi:hypothetical protein